MDRSWRAPRLPDVLAAIAPRKSAREAGACKSLQLRLRTPPNASSQAVQAQKRTHRLAHTHRHRLRHRETHRRRHTDANTHRHTHRPRHHGRDTWGLRKLSAEPPIRIGQNPRLPQQLQSGCSPWTGEPRQRHKIVLSTGYEDRSCRPMTTNATRARMRLCRYKLKMGRRRLRQPNSSIHRALPKDFRLRPRPKLTNKSSLCYAIMFPGRKSAFRAFYSKPTDGGACFLRVIGCDVQGPRRLLVKPIDGVPYRLPTLMGRHNEARARFLPVPDTWHHTHV